MSIQGAHRGLVEEGLLVYRGRTAVWLHEEGLLVYRGGPGFGEEGLLIYRGRTGVWLRTAFLSTGGGPGFG